MMSERVIKKSRLSDRAAALANPATSNTERNSHEYKAGMIKHVSLVNFMNHASLELDLAPTVNIITGRNGSGKSSIIQAIVLGLGGGAKDTKRGEHLHDFIRREAAKAEVRIHLDNTSEEAYRPEMYGNTIIFERTIQRVGGGSNSLRNDKGVQVYQGAEATKEKARILKHLFIEVDNPLTFLHQEDAKVFFRSNNSSSLYNYTMRATSLNNAQVMYTQAQSAISATKETMAQNQSKSEAKSREYARLCNQMGELKKTDPEADEDETKRLEAEKVWHLFAVCKRRLDKQEAELSDARDERTSIEQRMKEEQDDLKGHEIRLEQVQMQQQERQEKLICLKEETDKAEKEHEKATEEYKKVNSQLEELKIEQNSLRSQHQDLTNKINAEKHKSLSERESRKAARDKSKTSIAQLKQEIEEMEGIDTKLRQAIGRAHEESLRLGVKGSALKRDKANLEVSLRNLDSDLMAHGHGASSDLHCFGPDVARFAEAVRNASGFKKRPIGPIGQYVALNASAPDNIKGPIEAYLDKNFLRTFLVDNQDDFKTLFRMMAAHFKSGRKPDICISPFQDRRVDFSSGQVKSMKVILDFLSFTHDEVFNHVVESKHVESTVVVDEDEEAQRLFENAANVPKKALCAITPRFYKYFPVTSRHGYSSYYMDRPYGVSCLETSNQNVLAGLLQQKAGLEKQLREKQAEIAALETEHAETKRRRDADEKELERHRAVVMKAQKKLTMEMLTMEGLLREGRDLDDLKKQQEEGEQKQAENKRRVDMLVQDRLRLKEELKFLSDRKEGALASLNEEKHKGGNDEFLLLPAEVTRMQEGVARRKRELEANGRRTRELEQECAKTQKQMEKARQVGLTLNQGEEMANARSRAEIEALQAERSRVRNNRLEALGCSLEELRDNLARTEAELQELKRSIKEGGRNLKRAEEMNVLRKNCFVEMRNRITRDICRRFALAFSTDAMFGKLSVDHTLKTLELLVSHVQAVSNGEESSTTQPMANLSGGERSRTLCTFMLALWEHVWTPFRCLDEWDVYLDPVVRPEMEHKLYSYGINAGQQFIFISPQQCSIQGANIIEIEKRTT